MPQTSLKLPEIADLYLPTPPAADAESLGSVSLRHSARLFAVPSQRSTRSVLHSHSQPEALNPQMSNLRAVVDLLAGSVTASLPAPLSSGQTHYVSSPSTAMKHRLALNELDLLCRTRAGYAFIDLTPELQEAVLSLIASRDLTTPEIDLAVWLEDLSSTCPRQFFDTVEPPHGQSTNLGNL